MRRRSSGVIPGVNDQELLAALKNLASVPAPTTDDADRFARETHAIAESRAQGGWSGEGESDLAVFVLTPYPRLAGDRFGAAAVSNLIASSRPILGEMFFLNRDASYGRCMELPTDSDGIVDWLSENDLGQHPVAFVHRTSRLMLVKASGATGDITRKEWVRDKPAVATIDEIDQALNHTHIQILITPAVCPPGIWEKGRSAQYIPGVEPEKVIQREIRSGLGSWFRGLVRAELEDTISSGRIDVRLLAKQNDGKWAYWAIVELKVIRSSRNARKGKKATPVRLKNNAAVVAEGVRQVYAFARNRNAEALLEIFGLRKDKKEDVLKEQAVVVELAKCTPSPPCRVWPLFGSAKDARIAGFC